MDIKHFDDTYLNTILDDGLTIREHMNNSLKKAHEYYNYSSNPKFNRSFEETEQSFEFQQKYNKKIKCLENKIYFSSDNAIKYNEKSKISILIAIIKCKKSIHYYYKLKKFCYSNNGQIYFQDIWEYCHNSTCNCFEYIDSTKELKKKLINLLK